MNFRIGQQVRINEGQMYGLCGPVVALLDGGRYLVRVAGRLYDCSPFALLDSNANNGD